MNKILKFFDSERGSIILSILWGFGLATLFQKVCEDRSCIVIKGIPPGRIENRVYNYNNKCYKYVHHAVECDKNKEYNEI